MANNTGAIAPNDMIRLAGDVVAAYVSYNAIRSDLLPSLIEEVFDALANLAAGDAAYAGSREPAVPISNSVTPDFVICLEDGKKLKMLKRYLRTHYDMSPEEYRRKWGLPADYPMVAPNYAKRRSQIAKNIGLGASATKKRRTTKKTSGARKRKAA